MSNPKLFRSAGIVSLGTLTSRLLGFVREMMMAWTFGTTLAGSAFFVAFTIPNLFRRLFGEGALSAAFIPAYVRVRDTEGQSEAWGLARNLGSLLVIFLGVVSVGAMLVCWALMGRDDLPERVAAVLPPLRIMLPYTVGICLAALVMGMLNSHRKFAVPAFTPAVLNVVWIVVLWGMNQGTGWSPEQKTIGLAWAVLLSGVLQFGVQVPGVLRLGYRAPEGIHPLDPKVRRVLVLMLPAALGAAVTQINVLLDRLLALWVADYGPSALSFAERLVYLPLGLFATALGTILLPEMAGLARQKSRERMEELVDQSLRGLSFLMLPAALGLCVFAEPIVRLAYARGEFDLESVRVTTRALQCYAPGLLVFSLAKVFVPIFYAHADTKTPVRIGAAAVGVNLALNLLFIVVLPNGWKHAGLALGTVVSELGQVAILARLTHVRHARLRVGRLAGALGRHLLACVPMLGAVVFLSPHLDGMGDAVRVLVTVSVAALAYVLAALVACRRELREFRHH